MEISLCGKIAHTRGQGLKDHLNDATNLCASSCEIPIWTVWRSPCHSPNKTAWSPQCGDACETKGFDGCQTSFHTESLKFCFFNGKWMSHFEKMFQTNLVRNHWKHKIMVWLKYQ